MTNATPNLPYAFAWTVRDPSGSVHSATTSLNPSTSTFTSSVNYPSNFGTSITFVGIYTLSVNQTSPPPSTNTPAATSQFKVGLTNALVYQRTMPLSLTAQGYQPLQNVTIAIYSMYGPAPSFPTSRLATSAGALSFTWTSIPPNVPLANYTVRLTANPAKAVTDVQSFRIDSANITIPQLLITQNSLQRSQRESFMFSASYPNTGQVRTGSGLIRIIEADGITEHDVTATYKTTLGEFEGSYQIPLNASIGAWVASIDIGGFNDGYGNIGPISSVPRGFAVSPATMSVSVTTDKNNYTAGDVVAIYSRVVTPDGTNFTTGSVVTATFLSGQQIRNAMQLSFDQTRGLWVGSYVISATDSPGVWIVKVNASDSYGNSGYGSVSTLVTITPTQQPPQQTATFNYLTALVVALAAALGILGAWVVYRRGRISRKVLKVDLEAVHAEAEKVENDAFFKKVREQLNDLRKEQPKSDADS